MEVAVCAQIQICNDRLKHLTKQAAALQYNQFIGSQQFGSQEYRVEDLPDVWKTKLKPCCLALYTRLDFMSPSISQGSSIRQAVWWVWEMWEFHTSEDLSLTESAPGENILWSLFLGMAAQPSHLCRDQNAACSTVCFLFVNNLGFKKILVSLFCVLGFS